MATGELCGALAIECNAILAAVDFERGQIQNVLILADFGIQFVNSLVKAILLAFLLLDGGGALQFGGGQLFEVFRDAFGFGIQFACLARQHLANDAAHLVADFGVATRFSGLALQRTKLLLDFDDDVVDAGEIDLGGFELGFGKALLGLELRDAGGFLDDGAALHGLGGEDQADAALLDDSVGIRAEADAHEHFLDVA